MNKQLQLKGKVLAVTMGTILSIASLPSATTTLTSAAVVTTVASFALTTDAHADREARKNRKAERQLKKAAKAYANGNDKKGDRHRAKADKHMGYDAGSNTWSDQGDGVVPLPDGSGDGSPGQ